MENQEAVQLHARVSVHHPKLAMVSMMLGAFVGMFSETSLNIALPQLMAQLHVNQSTVQWLVTGYMLVIGVVLPLSSLLTKWFTTRQIVIFGLCAFTFGAIVSAIGNGFLMVLIGRMIQGIGTGLILPLMFTVALQIFPPQKIGAVMGMCALVIMFAPAIGPTLTGLILGISSWRWVFWSFVPFLLIALIFAISSLENISELSKPHIDVLSILVSAVGFAGLIAGVSFASDSGWLSSRVLCCIIIGIIALIFYGYRQLHIAEPILNLRVFRHLNFRIGALMLAFVSIHTAIWYIILAHVILMIDAPLAMSPSQTSALNSLTGRESADGSTILNTLQQIVGALATALATSFLEMGRHAITGSRAVTFTNGVHYGFYFTIALVILGLILSMNITDDSHTEQ